MSQHNDRKVKMGSDSDSTGKSEYGSSDNEESSNMSVRSLIDMFEAVPVAPKSKRNYFLTHDTYMWTKEQKDEYIFEEDWKVNQSDLEETKRSSEIECVKDSIYSTDEDSIYSTDEDSIYSIDEDSIYSMENNSIYSKDEEDIWSNKHDSIFTVYACESDKTDELFELANINADSKHFNYIIKTPTENTMCIYKHSCYLNYDSKLDNIKVKEESINNYIEDSLVKTIIVKSCEPFKLSAPQPERSHDQQLDFTPYKASIHNKFDRTVNLVELPYINSILQIEPITSFFTTLGAISPMRIDGCMNREYSIETKAVFEMADKVENGVNAAAIGKIECPPQQSKSWWKSIIDYVMCIE